MGLMIMKLADELFVSLRSGVKRTTIRKGYREVQLGQLLFEGANDESLVESVKVTSVLHTTLGELPDDVLADDGFVSHIHAMRAMSRFYPNITLETEVTAITFEL